MLSPRSEVATVAKLFAAPGKGPELAAALEDLLRSVRDEEGTLVYILHVAADDPDSLWFYELYSDTDAKARHAESPAIAALGGRALKGLAVRAPEITELRCIAGKGL